MQYCKKIIWVILVCLVIIALLWSPARISDEKEVAKLTQLPSYSEAMVRFYKESAEEVLKHVSGAQVLENSKINTISIITDQSKSDFVLSSPSSSNLARLLYQKLSENNTRPSIIYWEPQSVSSNFDISSSYIKSKANSLLRLFDRKKRGQWYKWTEEDGIPLGKNKSQETSSLELTIEVDSFAKVDQLDAFSLKLKLLQKYEQSTLGQYQTILQFSEIVSSKDLGWFAIRKMPRWHFTANLFSLFLLAVFWLRSRQIVNLSDSASVGIGLVFTSQFCVFFSLYLLPLLSVDAYYSEQQEVAFIVDKSSELWPSDSGNSNSQDEIQNGYPSLAQSIFNELSYLVPEDSIFDRLNIGENVISLLLSHDHVKDLFEQKRLKLTAPIEVNSYEFTGQTSNKIATLSIGEAISQPTKNVESRLWSIPIKDLDSEDVVMFHKWVRNSSDRYLILLSSFSSPTEEELRNFLATPRSKDKSGKGIKTIALLMPSLPRTGSDNIYNFHEGKYHLASLSADTLIPLDSYHYANFPWETDPSPFKDWIDTPPRELPEHDDPHLIYLQNPLPGFFSESSLTHEFSYTRRDYWDIPRDLAPIRNQLFSFEAEALSSLSKEVADQVRNIIETDNRGGTNTAIMAWQYLDGTHWIILFTVVIVFALLFLECNGTLLAQWNSMPFFPTTTVISLIFSGSFLFLSVIRFGIIAYDSQSVVSLGNLKYTFALAVTIWTAWFAGPLIFLRLRVQGFTSKQSSVCGSGIIIFTVSLTIVSVFLFSVQSSGNSEVLTIIFGVLGLLITLTSIWVFLPLKRLAVSRDYLRANSHDHFEWWRNPMWNHLVKLLAAFGLMQISFFHFSSNASAWSPVLLPPDIHANILIASLCLSVGGLLYMASARNWILFTLTILALFPSIGLLN